MFMNHTILAPYGYKIVNIVTEETLKTLDIKDGTLLGCDSRQYSERCPSKEELQETEFEYERNPRCPNPSIECIVKVKGELSKTSRREPMHRFTGEIEWATTNEHAWRSEDNDNDFCLNIIPPVFWFVMEKID
ncbi:hypothetical protein VPHK397_0136 [Vibrio phage K397]